MNSNYQSQIKNSCMKRRLLKIDNIAVIEDILEIESQRLEKLQKLKKENKLNLGDKVSSAELKNLFPQICTEVDDFLSIQNSKAPNCRYFTLFYPDLISIMILSVYALSASQIVMALASQHQGKNLFTKNLFEAGIGTLQLSMGALMHSISKSAAYRKSSKTITLEKTVRTSLIPVIGHEYAHSIQHTRKLMGIKYSIFMEGHARGVEKQLAKTYCEREDNETFLYDISDSNLGEYKSAYIWMCKKLGMHPRKSLLKIKSSRDGDESFGRLLLEPTPHAIGNTLFSIYESSKGKEIYKQMIQENFQFDI